MSMCDGEDNVLSSGKAVMMAYTVCEGRRKGAGSEELAIIDW